MNNNIKSTQELQLEAERQLQKKKEEFNILLDLINRVLNNNEAKKLLSLLENNFNKSTDLNNPNVNYYRDGALSVFKYINNLIEKVNKKY